MASRLAGKHCAIIGATGIIGSSIAKAFAAQGAVLSLMGRTALDIRPQLESQLTKYQPPSDAPPKRPAEHRFFKLDVTKHEQFSDVLDKGMTYGGPGAAVGYVDVLINCAGISQQESLKKTPDSEIDRIINTNLTATALACKHAKIYNKGCIINVSSLMATKPAVGASVYAAAKAGVIGLTKAICLEKSIRSVRVNALLPGWVQSPMWEALRPKLKEDYLQRTPLRRVATPEEVADAAVFLASNEFANNCVLNLDGGLSAS